MSFHRHSSARASKPKDKTNIHKSTTSRNLTSIHTNEPHQIVDESANGQRLCRSALGSYRYDSVDTSKKKNGVIRKVSFDM